MEARFRAWSFTLEPWGLVLKLRVSLWNQGARPRTWSFTLEPWGLVVKPGVSLWNNELVLEPEFHSGTIEVRRTARSFPLEPAGLVLEPGVSLCYHRGSS
jgi:hypothetical protein